MKRSVYLLLMLVICSVHPMYGDEIRSIKLDNKDHAKETVSLSFCNLFVELQQRQGEEEYEVSVKLENVSEDKILYLFERPYSEKTLKKMNIVYDKLFPGAKGKRIAEACNSLSESYRFLPSSETKNIFSFQCNEGLIKCRLPIYIARYDEKNFIIVKKNRITLARKEVIELNIEVELKPDEEFVRLSEAADSLIEEIGRQTFCSNKNHRGTPVNTLYKIYGKSIDDLKNEVRQVVSSRNYTFSDKGYKQFMAVCERLDSIDLEQLTVTSCENDRRVRSRQAHRCKYCSLSVEDIYKRLESCYIDIHNGKKTKEQVMGEVEALYNCAQKNSKRRTDNYMSRISAYYNRIKSR